MIKVELVNCIRNAFENDTERLLSTLNNYSFKSYNAMPDDWKKGFFCKERDILNSEIHEGIYNTTTAADYVFVETMSVDNIVLFDAAGFVVGKWNKQKTAPLFDDLLVKVVVNRLWKRYSKQRRNLNEL